MSEKENIENSPEDGKPESQKDQPVIKPSLPIDLKVEPGMSIEHKESNTVANKPQTEEMEVHHHTHAGHGKKTWKDYFWEFLMLFLAVFCGFLAEYQLEHVVEHQREKEYIHSFIEHNKKPGFAN